MAYITPPPQGPHTPLWDVAHFLRQVSGKFREIYDNTRDVWLIGTYLSSPFYLVYWYLDRAAFYCETADATIVDIKGWLDNILTGITFKELLYSLSPYFYEFVSNVTQFVRSRVRDISYELRLLVDNPFEYFRSWLTRYTSEVYQFWQGPYYWLRDALRSRFPDGWQVIRRPISWFRTWFEGEFYWLNRLSRDPIDTILHWILGRFPLLDTLFFNPIEFVYRRLRDFNPQLSTLLQGPYYWFRLRISEVLGVSIGELSDLPTALVRVLFTRFRAVWRFYRQEIERLLVDIILDFI